MSAFIEDELSRRTYLHEVALIGRSPACNLVLDDETVSSHHALVLRTSDSGYLMLDMNSTNGVEINGARVIDRQRLETGDLMKLGNRRFVYRSGMTVFHAGPKKQAAETVRIDSKPKQVVTGAVLVIRPDGEELLWASDMAMEFLTTYFNHSRTKSVPEPLKAWIGQSAGLRIPPSYTQVSGSRQLTLRIVEAGASQTYVTLQEEVALTGASMAKNFGVTAREGEVLGWIAEGKSRAEISIILGISERTVSKHCDNLFAKLDVDNRAAAIRLVLTKLGKAGH